MDDFLRNKEGWNIFDEPWLRRLVGDANMPARKIGNSRFYMRGYVPSKKGVQSQSSESRLEQDFLFLLEFDRRVFEYVAQPFTIHWTDKKGMKRKYTPDVVVRYFTEKVSDMDNIRPIIYEVKPKAILKEQWQELRPKYKAAIAWAREYGCVFKIVTEDQIRTTYLQNARFLNQFIGMRDDVNVSESRKKLLVKTMKELKTSTPKELLEAITDDWHLQAELIPWLWQVVCCGNIGADLSIPLNMNSMIWWSRNY